MTALIERDRCPEFAEGGLGVVAYTCDLRFQHEGDHHDPATNASWRPLATGGLSAVDPDETKHPDLVTDHEPTAKDAE